MHDGVNFVSLSERDAKLTAFDGSKGFSALTSASIVRNAIRLYTHT